MFQRGVQALKEKLFADEAVYSDIPFARELGLSGRDIKWIARVREFASYGPYPGGNKTFSAYDLVKIYLLIQRDMEKWTEIQERTERKIDEFAIDFISQVEADIEEDRRENAKQREWMEAVLKGYHGTDARDYDNEILGACRAYRKSTNVTEKLSNLGKLFTFIHRGGRNIVAQKYLYGVPNTGGTSAEGSSDFFWHLNNLGMDRHK